jgi:hypothetical protein
LYIVLFAITGSGKLVIQLGVEFCDILIEFINPWNLIRSIKLCLC